MYWGPIYLLPIEEQARILGDVNLESITSPKAEPEDEEEQHAEAVLLPEPGGSAK